MKLVSQVKQTHKLPQNNYTSQRYYDYSLSFNKGATLNKFKCKKYLRVKLKILIFPDFPPPQMLVNIYNTQLYIEMLIYLK